MVKRRVSGVGLYLSGYVGVQPSQHCRHRTGIVANEAELNKRTKCVCLTPIYKLVSVAVEIRGALGNEENDFMLELGRRIATAMGERRVTGFLLQILSDAIRRCNASCVLGTVNSSIDSQNLDDDGAYESLYKAAF